MQRLKGRKLVLCALAVLACSVDPTGNEGTPTEITANPEVVFVTQGDSQAVIATVVDEDGQQLEADFTASNVGAGITVVEDPTFLGTLTGVGIRRQARFFVKGDALAATSFTLNALGLTKEITVTSVPGNLQATFSNTAPLLGDTVTITAPSGTFFTEGSVLTFGGAEPVIVSQDASTIVFIPGPNITGPAVVSAVGVTSNPALTFDLATPDTLRTDSILDIGANVTPTTPALAQTVTLVLPAELRVIPESLANLTIANAPAAPRDITVSADSLTITFVPSPNADSFVVVPGVIPRRLPQYPLQLATTVKVTTPVVDSFPSTVSDAAPDVNEAVTLTSTDANFVVGAASEVTVGATAAVVTGRTANSITFVAPPGATGPVTVTGVEVAEFPLTLPSTAAPITVSSTVTPLAGTDDPGTAPAIDVPAAGGSTITYDTGTFDYAAPIFGGAFGTFPARLYEITVPAGTFTLTLEWSTGEDLGGYYFLADGTTEPAFGPADAHGEGADSSPETSTDALTAGTYLIAVVNFSATDPVFSIRLDAE